VLEGSLSFRVIAGQGLRGAQKLVGIRKARLGFDGALGTIVEVEDGKYTGRAMRSLHAENKARCIRELGYDLDASTAYSDSHTDLPFLEAVGHPVISLARVGFGPLRLRDLPLGKARKLGQDEVGGLLGQVRL